MYLLIAKQGRKRVAIAWWRGGGGTSRTTAEAAFLLCGFDTVANATNHAGVIGAIRGYAGKWERFTEIEITPEDVIKRYEEAEFLRLRFTGFSYARIKLHYPNYYDAGLKAGHIVSDECKEFTPHNINPLYCMDCGEVRATHRR